MKSLLRFLPVPENFYDIKKTCNLITTPAVIFPYTVTLYVAGMASFASFFAYYSRESSYVLETIIQPSSERAGFTCTPLQPDAHYGVTFNYDECQRNMANPSADSVILEDSCAGCSDRRFSFYPFGSRFPRVQLYDSRVGTNVDWSSLTTNPVFEGWATASSCFGHSVQYVNAAEVIDHVTTFTEALSLQFSGNDQGFSIRERISLGLNIATYELYYCTITLDEAVDMYNKLLANTDLCSFTKDNAPYSCVRHVPTPLLQRASLAYANASLLYGAASALFAQMLYRSSRTESPQLGEN